MNTIIEQIKAEIDKRYAEYSEKMKTDDFTYYEGIADALDLFEQFIDTLESEKPINPADAMKEIEEKIALVKQRGSWDGVDVDKFMDEVRGREPEKPVPNDLDFEQELYNHFGLIKDFTLGMRIGQYFYNLGRDSVPLPEDTVLFNKGVEEGRRLAEEEQADLFTIVALDAAQRAKEQMLKDGLEGEIIKDSRGNNVVRAGVFNKDFECGDKVRVIILPKED